MIEPQILIDLYTETHRQIKERIAGLTHEESLIAPPGGGNCLNWVLGHIMVARSNVLALLGAPTVWTTRAQFAPYLPGSPPLAGGETAQRLETIAADLDRTQEQLVAALRGTTAAALGATASDGRTLGAHLAFYQSHESFHAGQVELLRQLLGK